MREEKHGKAPAYLAATRTTNTHTTMPAVQGYCVKCKDKRDIKDAKEVTMANGRKAMKGVCPKCGTGMFKIMGK
jgi:Zn finger protein HypA/HybF involved in hydrogenase expression